MARSQTSEARHRGRRVEPSGGERAAGDSRQQRSPDAVSGSHSDYPHNQHMIDRAKEIARRRIAANALGLPADLVERQRRTIEAVHGSAVAALRLADAVKASSTKAEGPTSPEGYAAALHNHALDFLHSAVNLIDAAAGTGVQTLAVAGRIEPAATSTGAYPSDPGATLTLKQRRVLVLLSGMPNKLIAYELGVTEATVKAHVSQVLHRLNLHSRAQVIARLARGGAIDRLA